MEKNYKECREKGNPFREEYLESIQRLLKKRQADVDRQRQIFDLELVKNVQQYRKRFAQMLGWPITKEDDRKEQIPPARKLFVAKEGSISIYRIQLEVMPDFWYYGMLFLREDGKQRPLVISQHGGLGTPELCSNLLEGGSHNYNDMSNRILQYDVNVFAPQMLLWCKENYAIDYNRLHIDSMLRQCGGSITALEIYCLMRSLDYLEVQEYVDPMRIGMVGLSYGGMYTLFMAALDSRIKSALSCSFFGERANTEFADWSYLNAGLSFQDAEIAMLVYPRKIYLTIGNQDPLFDASGSVREFERIQKVCEHWKDWCSLTVFEGVHEFCKDNKLLEMVMRDLQV